jgi:Tat protein translocase TatB subunit
MVGSVFGIGFTEMILVGIVILLLFSPRELPGMMKTIAQVYGSIRRSAEEFRAQVMEADELREPIEEIRAAYHGTKQELLSAQDLARRELGRARAEAMKAQQKLAELAREESRRDVPALKGRVSAKDQLDDDPHHHPPTTSATKPAATPAAATAQVTTEKTATSPAAVAAQVPIEKTATSPAREPTDRSDAA